MQLAFSLLPLLSLLSAFDLAEPVHVIDDDYEHNIKSLIDAKGEAYLLLYQSVWRAGS